MQKITVIVEGKPHKIEARRFLHYIGNIGYWFAYHRSVFGNQYSITHIDSGRKVCDIGYTQIAACLNNYKSAAEMCIDNLIEKHGADHVRAVLDSATPIKEYKPCSKP